MNISKIILFLFLVYSRDSFGSQIQIINNTDYAANVTLQCSQKYNNSVVNTRGSVTIKEKGEYFSNKVKSTFENLKYIRIALLANDNKGAKVLSSNWFHIDDVKMNTQFPFDEELSSSQCDNLKIIVTGKPGHIQLRVSEPCFN